MELILRSVYTLLLAVPRFRGRDRILLYLLRLLPHARTTYGPVMCADIGDWTNKACFLGYYGDELPQLIRNMPPNGTFLDFGANAGVFSLLAGEHLKAGKVFSFEPNRHVYSKLLQNLHLNQAQNITPLNFGIGDRTELVSFVFQSGHTGAGRIAEDGQGTETILILSGREILTLLELSQDKFCVCKIDTEGAELKILRTVEAVGVLTFVDQYYIEMDEENLNIQGASCDDIYELMDRHGYRPITDRRGKPHYDELFERSA